MLKPGKNENISNELYHADRTHISSSGLKTLLFDPLKYYQRYVKGEGSNESTSNMDLGSYVHSLLLEPEVTEHEFIVYPGVRRGERWETFKAEEVKGRTVLSALQSRTGDTMAETAKNNTYAMDLLQNGEPEYTIATELNGAPIKVRADYWNESENYIADVKTTSSDLSLQGLEEAVGHWHYDLSAALYIDAFSALHPDRPAPDFYFIWVGSRDVKDTVVYKASQAMIENGRRKYKAAIKKYIHGKQTGEWLPTGIQEMNIPTWAKYGI